MEFNLNLDFFISFYNIIIVRCCAVVVETVLRLRTSNSTVFLMLLVICYQLINFISVRIL